VDEIGSAVGDFVDGLSAAVTRVWIVQSLARSTCR
jgi:hypothetical protein